MSDPRLTPANGRVAHVALRGQVEAARYSAGEWRRVVRPQAPILDRPGGARLRELLLGARFLVLDEEAGHAFGQAGADGYVGHVPLAALGPDIAPSHRVSAIRSLARTRPDLKDTGPVTPLSFGAQVTVTARSGDWAETPLGHVPRAHLAPVEQTAPDPVAVAEMFLGTPYLWGGNSAFGIDCSGLVQAACHAAGIACPGDSDMQEASLGTLLPAGSVPRRGDLLFWKGHVALVCGPDLLIHANAHAMAVAHEGVQAAIARISAQGEGPVTAIRRLPGA